MDAVLQPLKNWLGGNWGWVVGLLAVLFDISPIKFNPVSSILRWIGNRLTGDIKKDIAALRKDVDYQQMDNIRTVVLDFANSCLQGRKHTKEEFDHILELHKKYKELVGKYEIENEVYAEAYAYIKRNYQKRMDKRDFLSVPITDPEG